jgi:hypothetical protein
VLKANCRLSGSVPEIVDKINIYRGGIHEFNSYAVVRIVCLYYPVDLHGDLQNLALQMDINFKVRVHGKEDVRSFQQHPLL